MGRMISSASSKVLVLERSSRKRLFSRIASTGTRHKVALPSRRITILSRRLISTLPRMPSAAAETRAVASDGCHSRSFNTGIASSVFTFPIRSASRLSRRRWTVRSSSSPSTDGPRTHASTGMFKSNVDDNANPSARGLSKFGSSPRPRISPPTSRTKTRRTERDSANITICSCRPRAPLRGSSRKRRRSELCTSLGRVDLPGGTVSLPINISVGTPPTSPRPENPSRPRGPGDGSMRSRSHAYVATSGVPLHPTCLVIISAPRASPPPPAASTSVSTS